MAIITTILGVFLAYKHPQSLNRIILLLLHVLMSLYVAQVVFGICVHHAILLKEFHSLTSHTLVIFLYVLLGLSIPASIGAMIRQKNILAFRQIPTGILVCLFLNLICFTGYLNPPVPGHETAHQRFVILHYFITTPICFFVLLRWLFLMRSASTSKN